jgi:dihydrofolate synthase/folylpolyglutamate synthase
MTYSETIEFLCGIRLFGQKLGLETMQRLLDSMGNPERSLRFIHVAGTNGKGSVAAMSQAVLTAAGYKTALYTSPHLVSFCERFQIDGTPVTETDVVRLVEQIRPLLDKVAGLPDSRPPTFFETVTALALQYFHEQNADVVIWETGLGGRLDATNVVTPLVSVITNVAFDHMQYLGDTLEKIAAEKCGIIKPGRPVVTAAAAPEALAVIQRTCVESGSLLTIIGRQVRGAQLAETIHGQQLRLSGAHRDYGTLEIPLVGAHQTINCATAVAALEASGISFGMEDLRNGLKLTRWPGRFQIVSQKPTVVLDGAHNAAAAEELAATVRKHFPGRRVTLILGVLRDKNYDQICLLLAPLAARVFCAPVNSERTCDPQQLAPLCRAANPSAEVKTCANLQEAYTKAAQSQTDLLVITGSLFLVGEALGRLCLASGLPPSSEKEFILQ